MSSLWFSVSRLPPNISYVILISNPWHENGVPESVVSHKFSLNQKQLP